MAYLMVRYDAALLLAQNPVFLFFTDKYDLDCLKQILLGNSVSAVLKPITFDAPVTTAIFLSICVLLYHSFHFTTPVSFFQPLFLFSRCPALFPDLSLFVPSVSFPADSIVSFQRKQNNVN